MSMWNELRSLGKEEVIRKLNDIYARRNFPYEVRDLFPAWFEEQDWWGIAYSLFSIIFRETYTTTLADSLTF